jgi:hypothetical protein
MADPNPLLHPLLQQLESSLAAVLTRVPVTLTGQWSSSERRVYASEVQVGTGAGPFVSIRDLRWSATLACALPIAGIAFLATAEELFWVKSAPPAPIQPAGVSLHRWADDSPDRATFSATLGGAVLPGVPVACREPLSDACRRGPAAAHTGSVICLAEADGAAFCVLLLQGALLEVGRGRLWRLRKETAVLLPPGPRDLLTRSRTGHVRQVPSPEGPR